MLASRAEVVGLHPMTAPPKTPTLKGRVMVVCEARLDAWRPWMASLLAALALVTLVVKTVLELHYGAEIAAGRKH